MLSLVTNLASDCGAGLCPGFDSRGGCLYVSKSKAPGKSARPTRAAPCSVKFLSQPYPLIFDGGFLPCRDVAQPGRALAWGARGRQFKSARPDHSTCCQRSAISSQLPPLLLLARANQEEYF